MKYPSCLIGEPTTEFIVFFFMSIGIITLEKKLDYETIPQHVLTVTVSDSGVKALERRTVSMRLEIKVININDSGDYSVSVRMLRDSIAPPSDPSTLAGVHSKSALEILLVHENGTVTDITRETNRFTLDDTSKSNNLFTAIIFDGAPYVVANDNGWMGVGKLVVHVTNVGTAEINVTVIRSKSLMADALLYPEVPGAAKVTEIKQVTIGHYQRVLLKVFLVLTNGDMVEVSDLNHTSFSVVNSNHTGGSFRFGPVPPNLFYIHGSSSGLSRAVVLQAAFFNYLSNTVNLSLSHTVLEVVEISRLGMHGVNSTFSGIAKSQTGYLFAEVREEGGSVQRVDNVTLYPGLFVFRSSSPDVASVDPSTGVVTLLSDSSFQVTITVALSGNSSISSAVSFYCNLEPNVGEVDLGASEGPAIPPLNMGDTWQVPITLNPGTRGILALYVEIWFSGSDLNLVNVTTDLPHSIVSNVISIFGPLEPHNVLSNYVGEMVFSVRKSGIPNVTIRFFRTVDTELSAVPSKPPRFCETTVLGDIDLDCNFDVVDVGFIGAYLASSRSQFRDKLGNQMKDLTLLQKTSMDANWNEAIEHDDAVHLSRIYLGMAKFVMALNLQIPDPKRNASDRCSLEFTVKLANKDGSAVAPSQGDVYFVFSHSSSEEHNQFDQTVFNTGAKVNVMNGSSLFIGIVKAENGNGMYTIAAVSSKLELSNIGIFLVQVVKFLEQRLVAPMFITSNRIYSEDIDVSFDNNLRLETRGGFSPQRLLQFSASTERCNGSILTIDVEIVFEGEYARIRGKEAQFETILEKKLSSLYEGATFSGFRFREGSIVTTFEVTMTESQKDLILEKLWADVQDGLKVDFDGATLTTLPTMRANGKAYSDKATDLKYEDHTSVYSIIIACTVAFVVLFVAIIVVFILFRQKRAKVSPSPPESPEPYSAEQIINKDLTSIRYISTASNTPQSSSLSLKSPSPIAFEEETVQVFEENEEKLPDTPVSLINGSFNPFFGYYCY